MQTSDTQPRERFLNKTLWAVIVLLIVLVGLGWWASELHVKSLDAEVRARLRSQVADIAGTINPDLVKQLTFTAADKDNPAFQQLREQMTSFQAVGHYRGIYSMALRSENLFFGPESYASDDPYASPPGTMFQKPSPEDFDIFKTGRPFTAGPTTDEYGTFVSSSAPVFDPKTGQILMTVGLDIEASEWQEMILRHRLWAVVLLLTLIAPLANGIIILCNRNRLPIERWGRRRYAEVYLLAVFGLTATLIATVVFYNRDIRFRRNMFEQLANVHAGRIMDHFRNLQLSQAKNLPRFFQSSEEVNRREFHYYLDSIIQYSDVQTFGWIPRIDAASKEAVEKQARTEGVKDFIVWQKDTRGFKVPARDREIYYPALYVKSLTENDALLGYDFASDPICKPAIEKMIQSGLPATADDPVGRLNTQADPGILVFCPVFSNTEQQQVLQGCTLMELHLASLLSSVFDTQQDNRIPVIADLYELGSGQTPHIVACSSQLHTVGRFPHLSDHSPFSAAYPLFLFDRSYALLIYPRQDFLTTYPTLNTWLAALIGLTLTTLLSVFVLFLIRRRDDLELMVQNRTAELKESEKQFRDLSENALSAVTINEIVFDHQGVPVDFIILQANASFETHTGFRVSDVLGKHATEIFPDIIETPIIQIYGNVSINKEVVMFEYFFEKLQRYLYIRAYPVGPKRFAAIFQDITPFVKAREEAEAANIAKSEFLAGMSHEIRTPLNAIISFSEMISKEGLTDEQKADIETIRESGIVLLDIIDDILDFSKIEAKRLDLEILECSLEKIISCVDSMMRTKADQKSLDFQIIKSNNLPEKVKTDPVRLRQCLINLVGNAIKFTEKGHVYMNVSLEQKTDRLYIRFKVEDSGIGIPQDAQKVIFEPFKQADGSTTRKYGGSGLGLTITKRLAEMLKGSIHIQSKVGTGSVFTLDIPIDLDVDLSHQRRISNGSKSQMYRHGIFEQKKFSGCCLVAEDVQSNQKVIKRILNKVGLDVVLVNNGQEAVEQAMKDTFDLIFMDMHMPTMHGYDATRMLRSAGVTTPIIALTAHAIKGDDDKCFAAGCSDYLTKPIVQQKLFDVLEKYLTTGTENAGSAEDSNADSDNKLIDGKQLMEQFSGDETFIRELTDSWLAHNPETIAALGDAIKAREAKDIFVLAHAIKGAAANIYANAMVQAVRQIEKAARLETFQGIDIMYANLQTEYEKLKTFLSQPDWLEMAKQNEECVSTARNGQ